MVGANTTSVYPCRSCEIPRENTEKMQDCHLVARTCDNEVGVAISIRDPYTSPFTNTNCHAYFIVARACERVIDSLAVFYWSAVYAVKP